MPNQYTGYPPLAERFWSFVDKTPGYGPWGDCWQWKGGKHPKGYAIFNALRELNEQKAHRVSYILNVGPIPDDLPFVLHRCDIRDCTNYDHLFPGTNADNMADMMRKGRQAKGDRSGARLHPEKMTRGEKHGRPKLTEAMVREIRRRYAEAGGSYTHNDTLGRFVKKTVTFQSLADEYGVAPRTIGAIVNRVKWKHVE